MVYLNDLGVICNLGSGKTALVDALLRPNTQPPQAETCFTPHGPYQVGRIDTELPPLPAALERFDCRNNRLAAAALSQIEGAIENCFSRYGAARIGVVMATSTSGIAASEEALGHQRTHGAIPPGYHAVQGALGGLGEFVASYLRSAGPTYTLSTACSSSGNALLSARRLLRLGLCDAVICGGVDSLCELTLHGFGSLEAQSAGYNRPFAADRDGINIGEAAAIFLLTREGEGVSLAGAAGSSDAHHISAPHPEGQGAEQAMLGALNDAGLTASDIDYLNLHGTGTVQNDDAEAKAVQRLFGTAVPCSSTKAFTGHCLGAASALELGICWLLLNTTEPLRLPPSAYLAQRDTALAPIALTGQNERPESAPRYCMSNSFAFGGNNVSVILGHVRA